MLKSIVDQYGPEIAAPSQCVTRVTAEKDAKDQHVTIEVSGTIEKQNFGMMLRLPQQGIL